jgi:general secretion pathway protein L
MEQLFIRLGAQQIDWLVWQPQQREVIASGSLRGPEELSELSDRARSRDTLVLVSGQDVLMTEVALPAGSQRLLPALVPNSLEDELASDIEDLHFAWSAGAKPAGMEQPFAVAVVAHKTMQQWQQWLNSAGIEADFWCADSYAVPAPTQGWNALQLGDEVIVRSAAHSGFTVDSALFAELAMGAIGDASSVTIHCYGPLPAAVALAAMDPRFVIEQADIEVPLSIVGDALSVRSGANAPINLRQHSYKPSKKRLHGAGLNWRPAAFAAAIMLTMAYLSEVIEYVRLGQQQSAMQQAIEDTYRAAFPNETRIVNVRSQLQQRLDSVGGNVGADALAMLSALEPGFRAAPDIKVELLRFDAGVLRITARAASFNSLEQFRAAASAAGTLVVEQGPVNNQTDGVSGSFIVRMN